MKNTISRVKGSQPAPILLVANKLDLESQREVDSAEGKYFVHFECNADNKQFLCNKKFIHIVRII